VRSDAMHAKASWPRRRLEVMCVELDIAKSYTKSHRIAGCTAARRRPRRRRPCHRRRSGSAAAPAPAVSPEHVSAGCYCDEGWRTQDTYPAPDLDHWEATPNAG